ncbi:hypothetical protein NliqN6_1585 [Naganishia liquefaciens]|uniref:Dihydroxyacetone kinase n=1 Tax=Naganishia liquefaciens TaxID=104408 RepID=A0A8H3TQB0_9TREE|nr:hypothetical protein NliqN6_1585 [Naganishia liquefaciens]
MNKHIINSPAHTVAQSLLGLAQAHPDLQLDPDYRVVALRSVPRNRVALISGGGSGHEPAHVGFVGAGLLSASAAGNVFASPNVGQVRRALELVQNERGTLTVIMRYTGDVLLFGLAKEQHAVTHPGYPTGLVIIGDDVAVPRKQGALVGRRGLAGTILAYKAASAVADEGADLAECQAVAEAVGQMMGTIGAGLNHCHIPGTAVQEQYLQADEVEIGMGIHNEPGILKRKLPPAKDLITQMLAYITDTTDTDRAFVPFKHDGKDRVVLLVNNLGGISELELGLIVQEALGVLASQNIQVERVNAGSFMTSCNLPGFSLTLLLLPRAQDQPRYSAERVLELLDAPASAPGWKPFTKVVNEAEAYVQDKGKVDTMKNGGKAVPIPHFDTFQQALRAACQNVVAAEPEITQFDTIAGDGDCGLCLKAGAEEILRVLDADDLDASDVINSILALAQAMERKMDGTSGALYSIWTNALAAGFARSSTADGSAWTHALDHALKTLYQYTPARRPSRTLVDPLAAFTEHLTTHAGDFTGAVQAAVDAAEHTRTIEAKAGRAAYVGREALREANVPDPGAWGVVKILQGIQSVVEK